MAERKIIPFSDSKKPRPLDNGGGPPHNGDMEARVSKLEAIAETTRDRLTGVETRLTIIERTMPTKEYLSTEVGSLRADLSAQTGSLRADLHREINAQTWKLVTFVCGFGSALVAAVYFIAKNVS